MKMHYETGETMWTLCACERGSMTVDVSRPHEENSSIFLQRVDDFCLKLLGDRRTECLCVRVCVCVCLRVTRA